ncbi:MAG: LytTR family transcriptional regulator [Brevundimonas sp.]|nr:MAG: LytTR family transcriptional regulator [Brevundimonas sp.]
MQDPLIDRLNTPAVWAADLAACAVAGAVLGAVGPFGSFFNDALPVRLAYWMAVSLLSGLCVGVAVRLVWPRARRRGVAAWTWIPVVALLVSVPLALAARLIAVALWPGIREAVDWVEWYGQTLLVAFVYTSLYVAAHARAKSDAPKAAAGEARILDRLPPRLGRDLLCLQMEDHYVRLHTTAGSVLVLSPLARAIRQVGDLDGLHVHRSWWVARHAVRGVVHDGRNLRLVLSSGLEAPVARARVAALKAAGWLDEGRS